MIRVYYFKPEWKLPIIITLLSTGFFFLGCKPVFTFKKTFHGLYTNHRPGALLMERTSVRFLPEHHFEYESDDGCTLNYTRGIGTYQVKRNRVLLRFERHPEDQRQNFRLTPLAPTIKDSLTVTCTLNPAFIQKLMPGTSDFKGFLLKYRCNDGSCKYEQRTSNGTATFVVPKNNVSPWGVLEVRTINGRFDFLEGLVAFPLRDSSLIVYVDGMNPKNMHYPDAGDSMLLPIRHRFPGGFLVGPFRKKRER